MEHITATRVPITTREITKHAFDYPHSTIWAAFDPIGQDLKIWVSSMDDRPPTIEEITVKHLGSRTYGVLEPTFLASYHRVLARWEWFFLASANNLHPVETPDLSSVPNLLLSRWGLVAG